MKKGIIITAVAVVIVAVIGINVYRAQSVSGKAINVHVANIKEKKLRNTVMVPGTLKLADEQYVYFDAEKGEVERFHVTEGSRVQQGTSLVTYESDTLDLEQEQNKLEKKSSQLQIDSVSKQLSNLNKKQKELEKEMSKQEARDQIDTERTQLNLDLETAKIDLERNKLEAKSIAKKERNLDVASDINGTVLEVDKEAVNNTSDVQKPLIHIGNTDEYLATGVLSEYDALKIKTGQAVKITSDVLPDKEWAGSVKQIDYLPQQQASAEAGNDGANQYPVEVKVDDQDITMIKPGFKLLLEIETSSKKASSLPIKAVVNEDGEKYVYVVKDKKAVRKEVKIGETTNKFSEIKSGVSSKDKVITNPTKNLTDGAEVTVQ
ncbi:efflux RND transporter periplasmic adaptor subunit [Priestia megaterium]|jgi:HlyD family secretion protein|uniref:Efflux transporter, RND family, MFP subunit n=1 Tax=Priestia megaterium (strain ATCC 14581 / DSM 32 / CCUG 1817 / JCM 2506 / NBRC 15308 / NCIMB 9376 / NCTC 10342 / NRRL B-14308 / VKM B-512 / Ford 19) TaxID=1348623 RepID=A0A0B6ASI0_PRIM2|nr:efflux RND transporter periplasmic adaptor subunit [Priestia megaterium]AJI22799.1 efflux transporter, RND family, MFP subunit [Priestia megaterium NBRC 15308 = ATCC 14581]KFM97338.1 efflux transporter, RND family, MFP subunit [Priestia megaterium]KGJ76263.1 RND transporter [Priestia megaterium NBRC 15308 = ATCC 14581]MDR4232357.1 efflux RND transporter periplasmic adaptor subunit [Priestia megaterium]MED3806004.1 efflux RND transporter periplasmic adaptor subunit [Priestia megaterium]